jgi:hypothetical protein
MRTDGWTTEHTQRSTYSILTALRAHLKTAKSVQMRDKEIKRDFNIHFGIYLHVVFFMLNLNQPLSVLHTCSLHINYTCSILIGGPG